MINFLISVTGDVGLSYFFVNSLSTWVLFCVVFVVFVWVLGFVWGFYFVLFGETGFHFVAQADIKPVLFKCYTIGNRYGNEP